MTSHYLKSESIARLPKLQVKDHVQREWTLLMESLQRLTAHEAGSSTLPFKYPLLTLQTVRRMLLILPITRKTMNMDCHALSSWPVQTHKEVIQPSYS